MVKNVLLMSSQVNPQQIVCINFGYSISVFTIYVHFSEVFFTEDETFIFRQ